MFLTAALPKTMHREPVNAMNRAGGSNLQMEPIRRERRVKTTAVKNRSGSGQEEDGGHLTLKVSEDRLGVRWRKRKMVSA